MTVSRTICLQGEPGSGKSMMACLTAVRQPVHVIDVDRKIESAAWAAPAIADGKLSFWELREPIDDSNIQARIRSLVKKEKPSVEPKGWERFTELFYALPKEEPARSAGTWVVDSLTLLNEHFKTRIMWLADRSKFTWDQWNALKLGWMDTFSVMRDLAKEHGKDLIVTVHERNACEPGDRTTGVRTETVTSPTEGVSTVKVYQGTQDVKVWASIDGAFGDLIGAQTDEYYWLYVDASDKDTLRWKCRVHPDGRRNLRTSFRLDKSEFEPDFGKIWK